MTAVGITPRSGYAWRVPDALIQTSLDGVNWTTVYQFNEYLPQEGTVTRYKLSIPTLATYVRYLSRDGGFGNVADLQFYGFPFATP